MFPSLGVVERLRIFFKRLRLNAAKDNKTIIPTVLHFIFYIQVYRPTQSN